MKTIKTFFAAILVMAATAGMADKVPVTFTLNEEAYIDDIPFNTEEIASKSPEGQKLSVFTLKEESEIPDIPFDTEEIAGKLLIQDDLTLFTLSEEEYIDDIPFNTASVAAAATVPQEYDSPVTVVARSMIEPAVDSINSMGILEVIIPIIIILGTLSYAVYEYILS